MKIVLLPFTGVLALALSCHPGPPEGTVPGELKCEYLEDPLGIDKEHPRFSWVIQGSAYDIL